MSSIMDIYALKQLDKRTTNIVFGYIRRNEKQLLSTNNNCSYYRIHSLIQYKVLDFVRDFFMFNYGEYKWHITNDIDNKRGGLVSFIKSFENGQKHESQIFEIGKLNWRIEAYPNGYHKDSIGSFKLYVKLLSLPPNWSNIIVCRTIECLESYTKVTNVCKYKKDESYGWTTGSLGIQEIKDNKYKTLTFKITIKILQINLNNKNKNNSHHQININRKYDRKSTIFYQNSFKNQYVKRYHLKWKISAGLMKKMKLANVGKKFESKMFNDIWCLQCCPNGRNSKSQGGVRIYLQLCGLPKGIGSIRIQYEIYCDEMKKKDKDTKILGLTTSTWVKTENCTISFSKFRSFKEVNIRAKIQIITEYDVNGHDLTIEEKEKEWNEYVMQQDENQLFRLENEKLKEFKLMKDRLELQTKRLDQLTIKTENIDKICDKLSQKTNKEWDAYIDEETQNEEYLLKQKQIQNNNKHYIVNNRDKIEINEIYKKFNTMSTQIDDLMKMFNELKNNDNNNNNNNNNNKYEENDENQHVLSRKSEILTSKQETVKKWLINVVDLEQYFDIFIENGFDDLDTIKYIDMNELNQIGINKIGHKIKILNKIKDLAKDNNN